MKYNILVLMLLVLISCGKENKTSDSSSSTSTSTVNKNTTDWMNATITTPTAGSMGGAVRITYNGKSYLIGNKTREDISNYLYSAPAGGTYPIVIKGTFSRETGYFPNPTATFDIITVTAIQ